MNYASGKAVQLGDTVYLGDDQSGVVVGIIEDGKYAEGYSERDWKYLGNGLIVNTSFGDLRLEEPDEDLELVARQPSVLRWGM